MGNPKSEIRNPKLGILVVFLFWFLAYGRLLWSELYWGDIGLYFYPMWDYVRESLREGRLPFWNPYINGGQPLIGNPQMGVFYPTTPLLYFLSTERWLSLNTAFHLLFSGFGMLAFLNSLFFGSRGSDLGVRGSGGLASAFGACAWIGCTAVAARVQFPPMLWAVCYYPWILYGIERLVQQPDSKRVALLGVLAGLCILCAHPQAAYMIALLGLAYFLFRIVGRFGPVGQVEAIRNPKSGILSAVLACLLALGLSAVYWLPVSAFAQETDASQKSLFHANRFYLPLTQILNPALPFLFGSPDKLYVGRGNFWEPTCFIGVIPLILALGFIRVLWRSEWKGLVRFALIVFLITYWLALGRHAGLYTAAYYILPGMKLFHDPARWLLISCLMLCILAAVGYKQLNIRMPDITKGLLFCTAACFTIYLFLPAEYYADFLLRGYKPSYWYTYPFVNRMEAIQTVADGLRSSMLWLGAGLALLSVSFTLPRLRTPLLWLGFATFQVWLTHALVPALPVGTWTKAREKKPFTTETQRTQRYEKSHSPQKHAIRNWYAMRPFEGWKRYVSYVSYDHSPTRLMDYAGAMMPNLPMLAQVPVWNAYEPVQPERVVKVREAALETDNNDSFNMRWMKALRIAYLLDVSHEWKSVLAPFPSPLPRIGFAKRSEPVDSLDETVKLFRTPEHNPAQVTLVEGLPQPVLGSVSAVRVEQDIPEYLRLKVSTDQESLLVIRETLLPGWEARIDGVSTRLYYADGVFRSLLIPAGEHIVELHYHPPRFPIGLTISLFSLLCLPVLFFWRNPDRQPLMECA
jgi:hypothetical protein